MSTGEWQDPRRLEISGDQVSVGRLSDTGNRDPVYVALAADRPPPYMFRGEPCANVGQLRLLLETECGMGPSERFTITECAVFLRDGRRRVMFTAAQGADGVVTVDPQWAES